MFPADTLVLFPEIDYWSLCAILLWNKKHLGYEALLWRCGCSHYCPFLYLVNSCDLALAPSIDIVLRLTLTCDPSPVLAPIDMRLFLPNCVNEVQDALLSEHILWALTDFSPDR